MARVCELTGKNPLAGNNVSHSNNKVRRRFLPNLCSVSLISDAMGLTYRFRVSANALKTVEHRGGLDAFLLKASNDDLSIKARKLKSGGMSQLDASTTASQSGGNIRTRLPGRPPPVMCAIPWR